LSEVLVVAEQLGRAVAPGPIAATVITSAVIAQAAPDDLRKASG
jgi:3-oxochol-4-en-24-oyl-CoA dehydrogenase